MENFNGGEDDRLIPALPLNQLSQLSCICPPEDAFMTPAQRKFLNLKFPYPVPATVG